MANSDAVRRSIPVTPSFTDHGLACVTPAIREALVNANWRITLPDDLFSTTTSSGSPTVSSLPGNLSRLDSQGGIYTASVAKVELTEQTVTLVESLAPGVPVTMSFGIQGIPDLENTAYNIEFDIEPPQVAFNKRGPVVVGNTIQYQLFRVDVGASAPYPEAVIKGRGRLFIIPSPPV